MDRTYRPTRKDIQVFVLYLLIDIVLIFLAFYIPYIIYPLRIPSLKPYALICLFWGVISILLLNTDNLYRTERELSVPKEILLVWKAIIFSSLLVASIVFLLKVIIFPRLIFGINFILLCITLAGWRMVKRLMVRYLISRGYNNFNTLIIGAGRLGKELAGEIDRRPYLGLEIVGFLDDYKENGTPIDRYKVLGEISDFKKVIRQNFVDEVLITIPSEREKMAQIIKEGSLLNTSVKIIPDQFDLLTTSLRNYNIGYIPVLEYADKKIYGAEVLSKKIMDIVLSGIGLILLLPLFIVLGISIKIDSKGPVFYVSKRYGKKGKVFNFLKFRSMVVNADALLPTLKEKNEADGPIFKMKDDPRITSAGKFMRRHSLDELPQLWNVLKGDMSIVGPRPLPIGQVENSDLEQLRRLEIRPGITGLWQIHGRSDIPFHRLVKWDIWYIKNWSLWLDLVVLARTIPVILKRKGAY
jgi:exopolysaccharide biosynthesis polyprenyl glycosylphosphotransferase